MSKQYRVTGNTYPASALLRRVGFSWVAGDRAWYGMQDAKDELERVSTVAYSRANAKVFGGLRIEIAETGEYYL